MTRRAITHEFGIRAETTPPFWLPNPDDAPFQLSRLDDVYSNGIVLEVRPRPFAARFRVDPEYIDHKSAIEDVVDELTEKAKWAIIEHYGLFGEIERRERIGSNFRSSPFYR